MVSIGARTVSASIKSAFYGGLRAVAFSMLQGVGGNLVWFHWAAGDALASAVGLCIDIAEANFQYSLRKQMQLKSATHARDESTDLVRSRRNDDI